MGIVFSRSKKKAILVAAISENANVLVQDGMRMSEQKADAEPEPHPDTPIPGVQEQETEPNTQQTRLESVNEWQEPDTTKERETEPKDEVVEDREIILADEEKEAVDEEEKIETEGNNEEIKTEKTQRNEEIEPNEDGNEEIEANEEKEEPKEIEANKEEKEVANEMKASEEKIKNVEMEENNEEKKESEDTNKTEDDDIDIGDENEEAEINEGETETPKIATIVEEIIGFKQLQQNDDINAPDENAPVLRLTPITARTLPKNYSSTLGTIWHWGTDSDDLIWDVNFTKTGEVEISVDLHNIQNETPFSFTTAIADDQLECACNVDSNYHTFPLETGQDEKVTRVMAGTINIIEPGAKSVVARVSEMCGEYVGNLYQISLKGAGVEGAVIKSRKANTVSATWEIKECEFFYSAIEITDSSPGTFFGVCCFRVLQLGLYDCQGHRSVWFQINQDTDDRQVPRFEILEIGEDVKVTDRRMEEAKTIDGVFQFPWSFDTTYHVMVKMEEIDSTYQYSAYFYKENEQVWKLVVVFKTAVSESEAVFGSLIEDRRMGSIPALRKAKFGPCWFKKENEWHQVETVIPYLVGHVVNTTLNLDEDKINLSIAPNPAHQKDVYASKILSVGNSVPSVLESLPE